MGVGIVEEITLDAPNFVIDLTPFGDGVDAGLEIGHLQRVAIGGLQGRGGGCDEPAISLA